MVKGVEAVDQSIDIRAVAAIGVGVEIVEYELGAPRVGQVVSQSETVGQSVVKVLVAFEDITADHG